MSRGADRLLPASSSGALVSSVCGKSPSDPGASLPSSSNGSRPAGVGAGTKASPSVVDSPDPDVTGRLLASPPGARNDDSGTIGPMSPAGSSSAPSLQRTPKNALHRLMISS